MVKSQSPNSKPANIRTLILSLFPVALHQQFIKLSAIIRQPFTARPRKVFFPCCLRRHNRRIYFNSSTTTLCLATMREEKQKEHYLHHHHHHDMVSSSSSSSSSPSESDEELQHMSLAPPLWKNKKRLSKQLSMCEKPRDIAWERRRMQERRRSSTVCDDLTDEDLHELKGCIELGFGFNEEDGQRLCNTLPALDLYFAVNRRLSPSPVSTPQSHSSSLGGRSSSFGSPRSDADSWKICNPGLFVFFIQSSYQLFLIPDQTYVHVVSQLLFHSIL